MDSQSILIICFNPLLNNFHHILGTPATSWTFYNNTPERTVTCGHLGCSFLVYLYPFEVGLTALQYFLTRESNINSRQAKFLVDSTEFCLKHNYFTFLDRFYLQLRGTAMGANFSPVYANLTMDCWEEGHIWTNNPFGKNMIFYGRYIDDILLIWDGGPDVFSSFVAHSNANSLGLSFTHALDPNELGFLDLVLSHDHQTIMSSNHTKPISGNSYLHYSSCHHLWWKNNIPSVQFNRLRRNCSKVADYVTEGATLSWKLRDKG